MAALHTAEMVLASHGQRLRRLLGQRLEASWVAWNQDDDSWFADEAVILQIGSEQVEIMWHKLDELRLTWQSIDPAGAVAEICTWHELGFNLAWRQNALPELAQSVGMTLTGIALIEYRLRTTGIFSQAHPQDAGMQEETWLLNGLELQLGAHSLRVFNALDENGVITTPPMGPEFRSTPV